MGKTTDVRICELQSGFEDYLYRTPIKFGGAVVDRVTLFNVHARVTTAGGAEAWGFGTMPLGNVWSFPSRTLGYDRTLAAMKELAQRLVAETEHYREYGHPIEISHALEALYLEEADAVEAELGLGEPIPKLCTLVTASPIDAALHDAWGKANGIHCYRGYGAAHLSHDLGYFLEPSFAGQYPERYVSAQPQPEMPLYHLVGALDPVFPGDVRQPVGDGLPETLGEWIAADGLTHIKIKLNGSDLEWDSYRVLDVNRASEAAQAARGVGEWFYSLDFNERCPHPEYLLETLARIRAASPAAFARIQYVEQPTARDLRANPENRMHRVAAVKPVVIDESLVDYESLLAARELGYTGVALKACKGQSAALLMASAAQAFGMFLCVQDLTCPGASLLHSAGLAAHVRGVSAIEANARQYVPAANAAWVERYPGIFRIADGRMRTGVLDGLGLGAVAQGEICPVQA